MRAGLIVNRDPDVASIYKKGIWLSILFINVLCIMEEHEFEIFHHPDFSDRARLFYEKYESFDFVCPGDPRYSKRNLKGYSGRTCRFCGRSYPDASFSNLSHLLPQLIGNSNLYSEFECDECNDFFSDLENDLATYLGLSRSIVGLHGEKKTPGFEARRLRAKSRSFIGNNILIIAPEDVEREDNTVTIRYTKYSYTPSNVYKALLKSALSLLEDSVVKKKYQLATDYLMGKIGIERGAVIGGYRLSFNASLPLYVFCFRRKVKDEEIPEYVICFNFHDHIIVLPLPCDAIKSNWNIIWPPPYFLNETIMPIAGPVPFIRDLASNSPVVDEDETITFHHDPQGLENSWCYDPATDKNEQKPFNPDGLKYMILTRDGVTVDPKALYTFIREQMEENNS